MCIRDSLIGARAELDVGQAIAEGNGNAVAFKGLHVRSGTGDGGGLVEDLPTKVLHLARADNGAAVAHVSSTAKEEDARAEVGVREAASNGKAWIIDGVIADAIEVDGSREVGVDASVHASDGAVSTTINQGKAFSSSECVNKVAECVNADGV